MDPAKLVIEINEKAAWRNKRVSSGSKIGCTTKQKFNTASAFAKTGNGVAKVIYSVDQHGPHFTKYNSFASDQSWKVPSLGNDYENMDLKTHMIKKIGEAEFMSKRAPFVVSIGSSTERERCTGCSATNSPRTSNVVGNANNPRSFSNEDGCSGSYQSRSFSEKRNDSEDMDLDKSETVRIGKAELGNKTKRYSVATSLKMADSVGMEASTANCSISRLSDKSSSSAKKGKDRETVDVDKLGIAKIDEAEFWKKRTSATRKESNKGYSATDTSGENVPGNDYASNEANAFPDMVISSSVPGVDMDLGIASRTRSKMMALEKFPESLHFLDELVFSTNGGFNGSEDDGFRVENSFVSERESLCLRSEPCDMQKSIMVEVSPKSNKKEGHTVMRVTKKRLLSSIYKEEENNRSQPTIRRLELSFGERQFSNYASRQRNEELEAYERNKVAEENGEMSRISGGDANADEGLKMRSDGNRKNLLRSPYSMQSDARKDSNGAEEVNSLLSGNQSHVRRQGKAVCPSNLKDGDYSHSKKDVKNNFDTANSNVQDHGVTQKVHVDGKFEKQIISKQLHSKTPDAQKDCKGAQVANQLLSENCSAGGIKWQKRAVSPTHSNNDFGHDKFDVRKKFNTARSDSHDHGENEKVPVNNKIVKQTIPTQGHPKQYDFCRILVDSVLERRPTLDGNKVDEEAEQPPVNQTEVALPMKFRFEDEVPKQLEKTESERELEGLFSELQFCYAVGQLDSVNYSEVAQKDESGLTEETQDAKCARGEHMLELQDDTGLRCLHCLHTELGPGDILPEWAQSTRSKAKKRSREADDFWNLDECQLASPMCRISDIHCGDGGTVWNLKPGIRESMYNHQQEGFEFLWINLAGSINLADLKNSDPHEVGGCIISHAPGTGKTRLTIVFIEAYLKLFPCCRPVIIAPASMLLTWEEEFKKWNVDFAFYNLNNLEVLGKEEKSVNQLLLGAKKQSREMNRMLKMYSWNSGGGVLGISYSLFEKLTGEKYIKKKDSKMEKRAIDEKTEDLRKILLEKPGLVFLDEGHTPRNEKSNIWNALLKLQTKKRVILSGTPFQNNFAELYNTLRLVRPETADLLAQSRFGEIIKSGGMPSKSKDKGGNPMNEVIDRALEKLKTYISPFVHVHKGTVLQESLPGLRDCLILLKPSALQKTLLDMIEGNQSSFDIEHKVALISVHPYLHRHCNLGEKPGIGIQSGAIEASKLNPNEGVKTKFILELVRLSMATDEKVLIFSQFIQPLELIKEQLKEIFKWVVGKQILQMEGKLELKQRQLLINKFNDPLNESKVMLASTRCCSEGISLVGASRVVLLDVLWNPSVEQQAISRAYRIGQKKFVYTYHLMTFGTIECEKYYKQVEKDRLSELVFCGSSSESNMQKLLPANIVDSILEEMVSRPILKEMFEKIINQPKDIDLIQTFGLTS